MGLSINTNVGAFVALQQLIPTVIDQNPCAHLRMPRGHDLPWLVDEVVPGLAAQRDDVFVGFEDPVRQPVVAHELPDILPPGSTRAIVAAAPGR